MTLVDKNWKGICFSLVFSFAVLLCIPHFQNLLLLVGGKILGRNLNTPYLWIRRMLQIAIALFTCLLPAIFSMFTSTTCQKKKYVSVSFVAFLILALFTSFYFYTCPFYSVGGTGTDSDVFIYIGQMMHRGFVPYRDMFDHKGIYLYFFEFLGTNAKSYSGIYILDIITLFVSAFFIFKTIQIVYGKTELSLATPFFIFLVIGRMVFEKGGNLTENYALPCISYSLYVFIKYLKDENCSMLEILFLGFTFTVVLFIRMNMLAPWVFFILYVFVHLIKKNNFSLLLKMSSVFLLGALIALVPVVIYFCVTKSLKAFWEYYILFNLKYISQENVEDYNGKLFVAFHFMILFALPNAFFLIGLLKNYKNKVFVVNFFVYLFTFYFVVLSGRFYEHYGIILLPFFAIPVAFILDFFQRAVFTNEQTIKKRSGISHVTILIIAFIFVVLWGSGSVSTRKELFKQPNKEILTYLKENTSEDADVLVYGNNVWYNIESNRFTKEKFFYQTAIMTIHTEFFAEFKENLKSNRPDYIVCNESLMNSKSKSDEYSKAREFFSTTPIGYEKLQFADGVVYKRLD